MKCENCGSENVQVADSRQTENNEVRRRRICMDCGERWTTYERAAGLRVSLEDIDTIMDAVRHALEKAAVDGYRSPMRKNKPVPAWKTQQ